MRNVWNTLYLSLSLLVTGPIAFGSESSDRCIEGYRQFSNYVGNLELSQTEKNLISDALASANGDWKKSAHTILNVWLRKISAVLEPDAIKHLDDMMDNRMMSTDEPISNARFQSGTHPKDSWVYMRKLEPQERVFLSAAILLHELTHATNFFRNLSIRTRRLPFSQRVHQRYLNEDAAMKAEYHYLNSIPESLRLEMSLAIVRDKTVSKAEKEFLLRILRNASFPLEEYLNLERSAGRYTLEKIGRMFMAAEAQQIVSGGMTRTRGAVLATGIFLGLAAAYKLAIDGNDEMDSNN